MSDGIPMGCSQENEYAGRRFSAAAIAHHEMTAVEDELRYTEALLAAALAASDVGEWEWNIQTGGVFWSDKAKQILGPVTGCRTHKEFLRFINVPLAAEDLISLAENATKSGVAYRREHHITHANGEVVWFSVSAEAIYDRDGLAARLVGIIQDITERKELDRRSEASAEITRLCLESVTSKALLTDITNYLQSVMGCDSVGVRMATGEDYPFVCMAGRAESLDIPSSLLIKSEGKNVRNHKGDAQLGCFCGMVIARKTAEVHHPLLHSTPEGILWTSDLKALHKTAEDPQNHPCRMHSVIDCESFGIVPIRFENKVIGLWHFSGHRIKTQAEKTIQWVETTLARVGIALSKLLYEEQLLAIQKELVLAQETAQVGGFSYDVKEDVWRDAGLLFRVIGAMGEIDRVNMNVCIHPSDVGEWRRNITDVIGQHKHLDYECRIVRQCDGIEQWVRFIGYTQYADADGEPVVMTGTIQNIDKTKRADIELKAYARRVVEMEERFRRDLATELHDGIGRDLSAVGINLSVVESNLPAETPDLVRERLDAAKDLIKSVTRSVRTVMVSLRPPVLDDYGLVAAVQWFAEHSSKTSPVQVIVKNKDEIPRFPQESEDSIFRIMQEAVTNAIKYSGAKVVTVELVHREGTFGMGVIDEGAGFTEVDPGHVKEGNGWGMRIMRERAAFIGAIFYIISSPGRGTTVSLVLPVV